MVLNFVPTHWIRYELTFRLIIVHLPALQSSSWIVTMRHTSDWLWPFSVNVELKCCVNFRLTIIRLGALQFIDKIPRRDIGALGARACACFVISQIGGITASYRLPGGWVHIMTISRVTVFALQLTRIFAIDSDALLQIAVGFFTIRLRNAIDCYTRRINVETYI